MGGWVGGEERFIGVLKLLACCTTTGPSSEGGGPEEGAAVAALAGTWRGLSAKQYWGLDKGTAGELRPEGRAVRALSDVLHRNILVVILAAVVLSLQPRETDGERPQSGLLTT